ncbi:MAG: CYTH domain-containing protein [Crocinitomicaceae bacterium]
MKEIEYKYLVDESKWNVLSKPEPQEIIQGFLSRSKELVVRVRVKGENGYLTIKGKSEGIARTEFEYQIPVDEAKAILAEFSDKQIIKKRYEITDHGKTWEVDVFKGALEGLILAELEVESEDEQFTLPDWVTEDVSSNPNYFNAVLIDKC